MRPFILYSLVAILLVVNILIWAGYVDMLYRKTSSAILYKFLEPYRVNYINSQLSQNLYVEDRIDKNHYLNVNDLSFKDISQKKPSIKATITYHKDSNENANLKNIANLNTNIVGNADISMNINRIDIQNQKDIDVQTENNRSAVTIKNAKELEYDQNPIDLKTIGLLNSKTGKDIKDSKNPYIGSKNNSKNINMENVILKNLPNYIIMKKPKISIIPIVKNNSNHNSIASKIRDFQSIEEYQDTTINDLIFQEEFVSKNDESREQ